MKSSKRAVRPAILSAPPSYDTAVGLKKEGETSGMVQTGVMSGVGMAALYCAKMAWEMYSSNSGEVKEEDGDGEEDKEGKREQKKEKLGWLGV